MKGVDTRSGVASPVKFPHQRCFHVVENCLGFNLRRADRLVTQLYDEALRPEKIRSTQFSLLVALRMMEPTTLSKLAKAVDLDRTTLTRNLELLIKSELATSDAGEDL